MANIVIYIFTDDNISRRESNIERKHGLPLGKEHELLAKDSLSVCYQLLPNSHISFQCMYIFKVVYRTFKKK